MTDVVVVGHVGRDLVMQVDALPDPASGAAAVRRLEMPGGKGANQAVGLAQLGRRPFLIGAVGDDPVGRWLVRSLAADGVDTAGVTVREGGQSSLIVSLVDGSGGWRYVEDLTPVSFLDPDDVGRHAARIAGARAVSLQLQQSWAAAVQAAGIARRGGALVVADGAPPEGTDPGPLLSLADVWRADRHEAELLSGRSIGSVEEGLAAARRLGERGPSVVAVATGEGDLVLWEDRHVSLPHRSDGTVDTTGAGDAFVAGLVTGLLRTGDPATAGRLAAGAASEVVARLGGRPDLTAVRSSDAGTADSVPERGQPPGHS